MIGMRQDRAMPAKTPVTIAAAPIMPPVGEYSGSTLLGQYMRARDERYPPDKPNNMDPAQ